MDRDPSTTRAMRGPGLRRAHVLTTHAAAFGRHVSTGHPAPTGAPPVTAPGQAVRRTREQRTLLAKRPAAVPGPAPRGATVGHGRCPRPRSVTRSPAVSPGQGRWQSVARCHGAYPDAGPATPGGGRGNLPTACRDVRKAHVAVSDQVGTPQPGDFPGRVIPGMLDRRGVSGDGQCTPPGPAMPTVMVPAVRLVRVTAGTARGRRERARAEVAG